ncbi:unnamed protein product [Blepharisma stoltei]|uniref:Uncharacterized protein n=1 Tax=Blepharisma stoltei TaxID=1481888 RepID=A0AAU9J1Y6_9CILI|nr:unnamed protein product [Blepharisma stoltei]
MSIFGGFGTRAQESQYNYLVAALINLLQAKANGLLKGTETVDELFKQQAIQLYDAMVAFERHKYLLPKFSEAYKDMIDGFKVETMSELRLTNIQELHTPLLSVELNDPERDESGNLVSAKKIKRKITILKSNRPK